MLTTNLTQTVNATVLFVHSSNGNLMQITKDGKSGWPRRQSSVPVADAKYLNEAIEYQRGNSYYWKFTLDGTIK
jgi:hypothetical protein